MSKLRLATPVSVPYLDPEPTTILMTLLAMTAIRMPFTISVIKFDYSCGSASYTAG